MTTVYNITDIWAKRRRDGSVQHGATAVTSESRLALCFIRKKHLTSIVNNNFYVLLRCRSYLANDVYVNILDETKVSILLYTSIMHGVGVGIELL